MGGGSNALALFTLAGGVAPPICTLDSVLGTCQIGVAAVATSAAAPAPGIVRVLWASRRTRTAVAERISRSKSTSISWPSADPNRVHISLEHFFCCARVVDYRCFAHADQAIHPKLVCLQILPISSVGPWSLRGSGTSNP